MPRYRKKPVEIDAWQWNGQPVEEWPGWLAPTLAVDAIFYDPLSKVLSIKTLEGEMTASPGDWIIQGVKGELYPCKPDIFQQTYDPAPPAAEDGP